MDKIKVAFLSRYVGSIDRGVETFILELSKRLSPHFQIDVLSGKDADSLKYLNSKYNLVIPTNGRLQALKAGLGKIIGGYKTLISGHAGVGRDDAWNIAITAPDVYVALTDFELNWAKKWAWKTKLTKIPNGIDLNKFSPQGSKIELDLEKPVVLSVGALEWYKYHDKTIRALAQLDKGSLLIIGKGPLEKTLVKMGNNLLGDRRFKIIHTDYDQIPKYYRAADLFTLPSWKHEAFGIVYLEAMASGLPVVAPDDSPRREIIGKAGNFVEVDDSKRFAEALQSTLNKNWGDLPIQQATQFSWDKIARQYQDLIDNLFV